MNNVAVVSTFNHPKLRELRRARKILSKDLAKKVGCTGKHLSKVENGNDNPSPDLVEKIAKALKVPPESLYLPPGVELSSVSGASLSADEGELIEAYRFLSEHHHDYVLALTLSLANKGQLPAATIAAEGYMRVQDARRASVEKEGSPVSPVQKGKR